MFIDIDYNKRPKKARLHLARPNKKIITHLHEKINDNVSIKLGNINEMSFTLPYYIDGEYNEHIDMVREKMLIKLTLGAYVEWYVVDSIEEDGDVSDLYNVTCFSLGYELRGKRISIYEEDAINATEFLTAMLDGTAWKIGTVDPIFDAMYRSFSITDSNSLESITEGGETYGALIVWDTEKREVSFHDLKKSGRFRGMTVNYGRFLQTLKRSRTTDEMVTRLYVYGKDDMSIHNINPTGQPYLEDYSFFIYPFERDENRNVIKSSYYMSDELCHALLDHRDLIRENTPMIKQLQEERDSKFSDLIGLQVELTQLQLDLENILELLDVAQSTEDDDLIEQRKNERNAKQSEIQAKEIQIGALNTQIEALDTQLEGYRRAISEQENFTPELLEELKYYIHEQEWRDDRYTEEDELYEDAIKKFEELRQPKVVIDVTIDNLLNIIEEQYYWDKIVLGDLIKVKYPQMKIEYMAKIIEINYDFGNQEVSIVVANTTDLLNDVEKLQQIIYQSSSTSTLVENSKYKWDKINSVEKEVNAIITQEWNANKNKIIAGVNNSIEVGRRGILITNPDFPNEMVIMQSGIIALSEDGGETWKTAIKPTGIVAERLIGQIIAGQELIITNSAGTFTMDSNGVQIDADAFVIRSSSGGQTVNLRDVWNGTSDFVGAFIDDNIITPYEKKMLKNEWNGINALYESIVIKLNNYYEDGGGTIPDVSAFHSAYNNLYNYLFVDNQQDGYALLSDLNMDKATRIDSSEFDNVFNTYRDFKIKVEEILDIRAKDLAIDAIDIADEAKRNIEELEDNIVWKIELSSSKGFTFKNGIIDTVITATVYRGKDNVTATLPNSSFIWKKYDKDGVLDTVWTSAHVNVGNVISVTSADVDQKAVFTCDIKIEE